MVKQKRRGKGEGSLYQRKSDMRWVAQITLEDGSRKEIYRKKREDAHKGLQQMLRDLEQGTVATDNATVSGVVVRRGTQAYHTHQQLYPLSWHT
jgi:hypothetical protein